VSAEKRSVRLFPPPHPADDTVLLSDSIVERAPLEEPLHVGCGFELLARVEVFVGHQSVPDCVAPDQQIPVAGHPERAGVGGGDNKHRRVRRVTADIERPRDRGQRLDRPLDIDVVANGRRDDGSEVIVPSACLRGGVLAQQHVLAGAIPVLGGESVAFLAIIGKTRQQRIVVPEHPRLADIDTFVDILVHGVHELRRRPVAAPLIEAVRVSSNTTRQSTATAADIPRTAATAHAYD